MPPWVSHPETVGKNSSGVTVGIGSGVLKFIPAIGKAHYSVLVMRAAITHGSLTTR
jgi:hypothetical protein